MHGQMNVHRNKFGKLVRLIGFIIKKIILKSVDF